MSGRVVLDGRPVPYFGVSIARRLADTGCTDHSPIPFRSADGRFALWLREGEHELIVAGPGFARRREKVTVKNHDVSLEIAVDHGISIAGSVTDESGKPVPDATVELWQRGLVSVHRWPTPHSADELCRHVRGQLVAKSDARGQFRIDNVDETSESRSVSAEGTRRRALPHTLMKDDRQVTIALLPVGTIEGVLVGPPVDPSAAPWIVFARNSAGSILLAVVEAGRFRITEVPRGEYELGTMSPGPDVTLLKKFRVVADQPNHVTLTTR